MILNRIRIETRRILFFAGFAVLIQLVAAVLYHAAEEKSLRLNLLGFMLFPAGWVIPFCLLGLFARRHYLRRDLDEGPVALNSARISKATLDADFDTGTPRDDQHVRLHGQRGRYVLPLESWKALPETQSADCQFFRNSRVLLSINGENVWPPGGQG